MSDSVALAPTRGRSHVDGRQQLPRPDESTLAQVSDLLDEMLAFAVKADAPWCVHASLGEAIVAAGIQDKRLIQLSANHCDSSDSTMGQVILHRLIQYESLLGGEVSLDQPDASAPTAD